MRKIYNRKKYPVSLKFDCRKMKKYEIAELAEKLLIFMEVQIIQSQIIFAKGEITNEEYEKIWNITDKYNVIID